LGLTYFMASGNLPLILNERPKLLWIVLLFGLYSPGGLGIIANLRTDLPNVDFAWLGDFSGDFSTEQYEPGPGTKSLVL
jgi:hypothetical protein